MFNDAGKRVKRATPSTPVEVLGLSNVPQVGDVMIVVSNEKAATAADRETPSGNRSGIGCLQNCEPQQRF